MSNRRFVPLCLLVTAAGITCNLSGQTVEVTVAEHAVSRPVMEMKEGQIPGPHRIEKRHVIHPNGVPVVSKSDGAMQTALTAASTTVSLNTFDGLGDGVARFIVDGPPDTNGAVGATQVVEWVNTSFEVFNKGGGAIKGPVAGNQLFQALGATHPCAMNNDGDPIAQYDKLNNRWILAQFSITHGKRDGFFECVAVSQTNDATGAFNVYAFRQPNVNDFPKIGIWTTGYFVTYDILNGNGFQGPRICGMDGAAMRAGKAATQQCFQLGSRFGSILPSDIDGTTAPAAGTDPYFVSFGTNLLHVWREHVDFANRANAKLTGPINTKVASFSEACQGHVDSVCIPQPDTTQRLDSVGNVLNYRLAFRIFADGHQALVANHSVNPPGGQVSGVRWYELRPSATTDGLDVFQQGTFSPADGVNRWLASIAQDKVGNIVAGYSVSSGSVFPGIRFAFRTAADHAGMLGSEIPIVFGTGSQLRKFDRWGDYSALSVDPVDDCTFWYFNEYIPTSGTYNWHTRITSLKLSNCQ